MDKVIYDFGNGIRYLEVDEPFNTKYPTWIVAYCPDEDSFFVTNERHFFWESEEEFDSEEEAIGRVKKNSILKKKLLTMLRIMLDIS